MKFSKWNEKGIQRINVYMNLLSYIADGWRLHFEILPIDDKCQWTHEHIAQYFLLINESPTRQYENILQAICQSLFFFSFSLTDTISLSLLYTVIKQLHKNYEDHMPCECTFQCIWFWCVSFRAGRDEVRRRVKRWKEKYDILCSHSLV